MPTGGVPTASPQDAAPDEGRTPDPGAMWDSDASLAPHAEEVVRYTMRASLDPAATPSARRRWAQRLLD